MFGVDYRDAVGSHDLFQGLADCIGQGAAVLCPASSSRRLIKFADQMREDFRISLRLETVAL